MPALLFDAFPHGKRKALIMSHDDGHVADRRLVETLNCHGLRGTFHLYSRPLGTPGFISPNEVRDLYAGHEVAGHSHSHPHLPHLSNEGVTAELMKNREVLESLVGYPVRGLAYPGGGFDDRVVSLLSAAGVVYARTTRAADSFLLTDDFLRWPLTCGHRNMMQKLAEWKAIPPRWSSQVMVVMGHSFDFDAANNWDLLDTFCAAAGNDPAVWYTTMIELYDYVQASQRVRCSVDGRIAENPSSIPVWATTDAGKVICIEPGGTWRE